MYQKHEYSRQLLITQFYANQLKFIFLSLLFIKYYLNMLVSATNISSCYKS